MEPLEPAFPHPIRRTFLGSGEKVECGADAENCWRAVEVPQLLGCPVLLRCPEPNPDKIGTRTVNPVGAFSPPLVGDRPERRRLGADDPNAPETSLEPRRQACEDLWRPANEIVGRHTLEAPRTQIAHRVRP